MSKKILVVEDDMNLLKAITTALKDAGFNVISSEDGESGLSLVKSENPDVVLLDIVLPKIDGFSVLKKMKKGKDTKDIPVILLTNLAHEKDMEKGLRLGAENYLVKAHFGLSEVVENVKSVLSKKE